MYRVDNDDPLLLPLEGLLHTCSHHDDIWELCSSCHTSPNQGTIPKFSAMNFVNVTPCQDYSSALEGLTLTEEYLIAKCHPLGVVLKLRPGGRSLPVNYHALRGHFIVIPQDLAPLLKILPNPDLALLRGRPSYLVAIDLDLNVIYRPGKRTDFLVLILRTDSCLLSSLSIVCSGIRSVPLSGLLGHRHRDPNLLHLCD